jgi:hypothetical protein
MIASASVAAGNGSSSEVLGPRERFVRDLRARWRVASEQLSEATREFDAARAAQPLVLAHIEDSGRRVVEARAECHTIQSALEAADRWFWQQSAVD